jgi:hypothetical protein
METRTKHLPLLLLPLFGGWPGGTGSLASESVLGENVSDESTRSFSSNDSIGTRCRLRPLWVRIELESLNREPTEGQLGKDG